jgi:hypothetical protein
MSSEETIAAAGGLVAMVGLPAYIGWKDADLGAFALYSFVAGIALAFADRLTVIHYRGESAAALVQHAIYRCLSVALLGGAIYGLAILAI